MVNCSKYQAKFENYLKICYIEDNECIAQQVVQLSIEKYVTNLLFTSLCQRVKLARCIYKAKQTIYSRPTIGYLRSRDSLRAVLVQFGTRHLTRTNICLEVNNKYTRPLSNHTTVRKFQLFSIMPNTY